ncbi:hypothetical protein [Pseudorhodobacter sp. MZDSW-24AT]|uniref:hypothetical protein n=1 Tax=Pseudorhodobacter sp. MZDSW-24AT TaxID=2052957 RepID=UPI000C1F659C|nr:hypothetical protein [Pseudorhodobacter sp. MZDSW-24AT]PJF11180.1 hypothetical protein CUR21_00790 [Pseudorhodobacter sp. MZDSW-24AT]
MRVRLLLPLLLLPVLAACQVLPGALARDATVEAQANPITGGAIAVTSLDAPAAAPASAPAAAPAAVPAPEASPETAASPPAEAPAAAEPVAPVAVKTAAQLACERRGGRWSVAGGGAAAFCQSPTRDAGQSCRAATDCTGYCLAKSGTCAPVTPMLGCHDILNDQGRMLTQCIN